MICIAILKIVGGKRKKRSFRLECNFGSITYHAQWDKSPINVLYNFIENVLQHLD